MRRERHRRKVGVPTGTQRRRHQETGERARPRALAGPEKRGKQRNRQNAQHPPDSERRSERARRRAGADRGRVPRRTGRDHRTRSDPRGRQPGRARGRGWDATARSASTRESGTRPRCRTESGSARSRASEASVGELEDPRNAGLPPTTRCCGAGGIVRPTACACAHQRQGASLGSAPAVAGLTALTPAPRTLVQTGSCPTMPNSDPYMLWSTTCSE